MVSPSDSSLVVLRAPLADLPVTTAYALLRLRVEVFVVEQDCAYPELDGRDLEPGAEQWWIERDGEPAAMLRTLRGEDAVHIGRVATAAGHRGAGLAKDLVRAVIDAHGTSSRIRLDAQTYLEGWYERFGFARTGPDFVEDGIPHLPMAREAQPVAS